MKSILESDAYLVLLLPEPVSTEIVNLRKKYDQLLAKLPVEITVSGSSGTGPIKAGQNVKIIIDAVDNIVDQISSFEFNFIKMNQFPCTNIFYLEPEQRNNFDKIHHLLESINIEHHPIQYPYNPHCSIHSTGNLSSNDKSILAERISREKVKVNELALIEFSYPPFICNILKVWTLK